MRSVLLCEHAKLIRGITFKPKDKCDPQDDSAIVCMRTKNVQATLDESDLIAIPKRLVKNPEKIISIGDILVSSANSWNLVGKCCQIRKLQYPSVAGGFISILRTNTGKLDSNYLYRWFSSENIQNMIRSFGNQTTNISNLDHKRTLNLKIPLPPLAEQKRIAAILDAADALRVKRRETIAQLDTLLQSIFLDMFGDPKVNPMGWDQKHLKDITSIKAPMIDPRKAEYRKLLHYGPDRIKKDNGELLPALTAEDDQLISGKFLCSPGDILYSKIRPYLNKVALVSERCLCSADVYPVQPDERFLNREYLWVLLRSDAFLDYVAGFSRRANIPKLNRKQFFGFVAPVPPFELQRRFATIGQSIEEQKVRLRAHLAELDILFASLQSRAFKGEL